MRVAVVHDWLVTFGGAERVLKEILRLYPNADLFSLYDFIPDDGRDFIMNKRVTTSFLQKMPLARRKYRSYLPLMPMAIEQFDLSPYDLIISNSYAVAKGVITGPDQLHVAYVQSPIRYAWDLMHQYLHEADLQNGPKSWLVRMILHYIRMWDVRSANGVDLFLGNSRFICRRINKVYRRQAEVMYPPVDIDAFPLHTEKEDFYLTASRMVPYKKIGLIVEAFARMPDKKLIVIGDGPEFKKIKAKATPNIKILGHKSTPELRYYMQRARAFVFAAEEDFGIIPVEAQACGTPVIAYGKGGALETVVNYKTGLFFDRQTPEAIIQTIAEFENGMRFEPGLCRQNAMRFSSRRFRREFKAYIDRAIEEHQAKINPGEVVLFPSEDISVPEQPSHYVHPVETIDA
jgi:glycosyltransferase involved in cell wall biosynthesis